jgi:hypothetical protein
MMVATPGDASEWRPAPLTHENRESHADSRGRPPSPAGGLPGEPFARSRVRFTSDEAADPTTATTQVEGPLEVEAGRDATISAAGLRCRPEQPVTPAGAAVVLRCDCASRLHCARRRSGTSSPPIRGGVAPMRRSSAAIPVAFLFVLPSVASAQAGDADPLRDDDRYVSVLAGKSLVEGRGFPGLFEIGSAIHEKYALIGNGLEKVEAFPFWYFHEKGRWHLVIAGEMDHRRGGHRVSIRSIYVEGEGAPATEKGVRIGDPEEKVVEVYGKSSTNFDGAIGGFGRVGVTRFVGPKPDLGERKEIESSFQHGRYYPAISTVFAIKEGRVQRIAVVTGSESLPLWLRSTADRAKPQGVTIDAAAHEPRIEGKTKSSSGQLIVPPPPDLEKFAGPGFELLVPKGWTRKGEVWSAPSGGEFVELSAIDAKSGGPSESWIDRATKVLGDNENSPPDDVPPPAFAKACGATVARAHQSFKAGADPDGFGLRIYTLLVQKGDRGFRLRVARRAMLDRESPDGIEFARQVCTSLRLKG